MGKLGCYYAIEVRRNMSGTQQMGQDNVSQATSGEESVVGFKKIPTKL